MNEREAEEIWKPSGIAAKKGEEAAFLPPWLPKKRGQTKPKSQAQRVMSQMCDRATPGFVPGVLCW